MKEPDLDEMDSPGAAPVRAGDDDGGRGCATCRRPTRADAAAAAEEEDDDDVDAAVDGRIKALALAGTSNRVQQPVSHRRRRWDPPFPPS
jgi:hypothetical protein